MRTSLLSLGTHLRQLQLWRLQELQKDNARAFLHPAAQAAEILLMMRPDTEVPSDFQDYTLVALVGVAVHLSGASPSEPAVLPTLVSSGASCKHGCGSVL